VVKRWMDGRTWREASKVRVCASQPFAGRYSCRRDSTGDDRQWRADVDDDMQLRWEVRAPRTKADSHLRCMLWCELELPRLS